MPHSSIADLLRQHSERLLTLPGVLGVAEGTYADRPCVLVLVGHRNPAIKSVIPGDLEGVPLRIVETGAPEAFGRP